MRNFIMLGLSCSFSILMHQSTVAQVNSGKAVGEKSPCAGSSDICYFVEVSEFRFKRPKYDCESGFWFCTGSRWILVCTPDDSEPLSPTLTERGVKVIAVPKKTDKVLTFLFPYALVRQPGNNIEDFRTFNVDEEITIGGMKLKKGDYPTRFTDAEIIIDVPYY
ncbi:hypothetical protein [Flavobacterium sp. BFFFF1]|uniref:hypothetical protein n=1 Tax=Flavobacterium sp. BFFFF1 TaxID=2015557 RepID=UPI0025C177A7|nr:hypothetical protein [Flavobacterium sp. BFFFF1]